MNTRDILREICKQEQIFSEVCTVDKVYDTTCDVTSVLHENPIKNVKLSAYTDAKEGIIIKPRVNSYVLVTFTDRLHGFVSMVAEIDSKSIKIGNTTLSMDKDNIIFNGGGLKGLVKLEDLVDRLNKIEKDINSLKQDFTTWTPVPNDGGGALKTATSSWAAQQLELTKDSDIENTKITHG